MRPCLVQPSSDMHRFGLDSEEGERGWPPEHGEHTPTVVVVCHGGTAWIAYRLPETHNIDVPAACGR